MTNIILADDLDDTECCVHGVHLEELCSKCEQQARDEDAFDRANDNYDDADGSRWGSEWTP